jgi:3-oxoadipate enol-lactonase
MTTAITFQWHEPLRLSYLQAGNAGPAVVLLHGWGAFKELWWSTLLALAPSYRAFAPDFPGHGGSAMGEQADMPGLARLIGSFCASLGLEEIILVGHSMGGCVAVELALERPDLVKRLVLVDAAVDAQLMPAFVRTYLHPQVGWPGLRFSLAMGKVVAPLGRRVPHQHGGGVLMPWFRRISYQMSHDPAAIYRILNGLFATEAGERLKHIGQPTLVISGQFDGLVPPAHSRRTANAIPDARFVIIPNALHNPMDEQPAAFEQALLQFLQGA